MKHSMTAIAAIIAVAGFAGAVQAQSMTPTGTSPTQNMQSTQYTGQNPTQPYGGQYNPYAAPQGQPQAAQQWNAGRQPQANPQWNTAQQPAAGTANWNQAQQNAMRQPGMASQPGMRQAAGGRQFWSQHLSRDEIRGAQQALREQGLYRGRDDGIVGSGTERAVARFQRRNGLRVTGSLDEETLAQLNGGAPQGYGASAGQPAAPMSSAPMAQTPTTGSYSNPGAYNPGAYNASPGAYNAAGTNMQGTQPVQR